MRRVVGLLLLLGLFILPHPAAAATTRQLTQLDLKSIGKLLPGKLMSFQEVNVAADTGQIFLLARDSKTRKLEWYLVDPFKKAIVAGGPTPFQVFIRTQVTTDGKHAAAITKYPSALFTLDVASKKWTKAYQNPKGAGQAFLSISPLSPTPGGVVWTVVDNRDERGVTLDSSIVRITFDPFAMKTVTTLKTIKAEADKAVGLGEGVRSRVDLLRYGQDESFLYVLQTRKDESGPQVDYLLRWAGGRAEVLDRPDAGVLPLDYDSSSGAVLYSVAQDKKITVHLLKNGSKAQVSTAKVLSGQLLPNDELGLVALEGKVLQVYMGTATEIKKVYSSQVPFVVAFVDNGTKVAMLNQLMLRYLQVVK